MRRNSMIRRPWHAAALVTCLVAGLSFAAVALGSSKAPAGKKLVQNSETLGLPGFQSANDSGPTPQNPFPHGTATSECPKGTKVAFGGFTGGVGTEPTNAGITLVGLERSSKRDWSASVVNLNGGAGNATSTAYCTKVPKLKEARGTVTIPSFGTGTASATCPRKKSVRLGGFSAQFDFGDIEPAVVATGLRRVSKRTLQVTGSNFSEQGSGTLEAIAYCGKGPKLTEATASASVAENQHAGATAQCPKKTKLAFGGYNVEVDFTDFNPVLVLDGLVSPSKRSWTASATGAGDLNADPGTLTSYVYCAKKKKK
jgi:hypothetical protein